MKKRWEKPTLEALEMKQTRWNMSIMGDDSDSSGDSLDSTDDVMGS
ncbi:hypothetical protein ACLIBH_02105 [Virgibacillus sp. W0430]